MSSNSASLRPMILNPPNITSLEKYTGTWEFAEASHLLRRTMFGPRKDQIKTAVDLGMDATLDLLLDQSDYPDPPVNYDFEGDPEVPVGETWVNAGFDPVNNMNNYRARSLRAWVFSLLFKQPISFREKMVLFWHNHFVVADIADSRFLFNYIDTLRSNAYGNFRDLCKYMTIDPAMLRYLNGNQNTLEAPNENYARELLELFTVGKGELSGSGDYTTFTEQDVIEGAKILTGWRDYGFRRSVDQEPFIGSAFRPRAHTSGSKSLSHRFDDAVISNNNEFEYRDFVDVIFDNDNASLFICRKIYRWLIYYLIDNQVEENIIIPMAQMLRENDYEIEPVLRSLLSSKHFYHTQQRGCMIKNPIDFVAGIFNQFDIKIGSEGMNTKYRFWLLQFQLTSLMQMEYFRHPTVAGWKAYYQEPVYYQSWINSVTLPIRMAITDLLSYSGADLGDKRIIIDVFGLMETLENPSDINSLIDEISQLIYPQPLTDPQKVALKEVLIPGLPDFEWTVEYGKYLNNPDDEEIKKSVEQKLRILLVFMLRMPEYQLS